MVSGLEGRHEPFARTSEDRPPEVGSRAKWSAGFVTALQPANHFFPISAIVSASSLLNVAGSSNIRKCPRPGMILTSNEYV